MADQKDEIPPDVLAQIIRQGGLEKRDSLLQKQLDQLQANHEENPAHITPIGAALGGIGHVIDGVVDARQGKKLRGDIDENMKHQDEGRQAAVDALMHRGGGAGGLKGWDEAAATPMPGAPGANPMQQMAAGQPQQQALAGQRPPNAPVSPFNF